MKFGDLKCNKSNDLPFSACISFLNIACSRWPPWC